MKLTSYKMGMGRMSRMAFWGGSIPAPPAKVEKIYPKHKIHMTHKSTFQEIKEPRKGTLYLGVWWP